MKNVNHTDEIFKIILSNIQNDFDHKGVTELLICYETILSEQCTYVEKILRKMRLYELLNIDYSKNRTLYDGDAIFFSLEGKEEIDCRRGDVLISFWSPFSRYIDGIPKGGRRKGAYCKTYYTLSCIIDEINKTDKVKNECREFELLAQNYWSRGNLLYLPARRHNTKHNMNSDRFFAAGIPIEDKVDQTLYHCFHNGVLSDYFGSNEDDLIKWIYEEHLECMFIKGFFELSIEEIQEHNLQMPYKNDIIQKNIQPMVKGKECSAYVFAECKKEEIREYVVNANKIIAYRNKYFLNE